MPKESLPFFGLEKITSAFMNIAVGIGALAIGASLLKDTFKPNQGKEKKH